jgi:hypothetical protein
MAEQDNELAEFFALANVAWFNKYYYIDSQNILKDK